MSAPSTQLNVLVIDDEPPIRRLLKTSFGAQGYHVVEAPDGESALEAVKAGAVDLIVLDLGLPGMDGFAVIKELRERGSAVPIVVLSSRDDEAGKVKRN
jgi:two-component system KDP operon response regulator KdpE